MEKEITWHIYVIYINCDINVLCPCFPTRHSHVWPSRCWQLIKETWICSGYLLMMRSIWLLWRKRRVSVSVQEATKTKAAGVKEICLSFFLFFLSFFFLLRVGERLSCNFEALHLPVWQSVSTNVGIWELFQMYHISLMRLKAKAFQIIWQSLMQPKLLQLQISLLSDQQNWFQDDWDLKLSTLCCFYGRRIGNRALLT